MDRIEFYKPENVVSGPAYSLWFKLVATALTVMLAFYSMHIAVSFPLSQFGFGVKAFLLFAALILGVSYYWFLQSTVTIDAAGIMQTWMINRHVEWRDIRSAKMIGIPYAGWLFQPRLVVRTGNAFMTFNGGSQAVLVEFAKISLAYQMKK